MENGKIGTGSGSFVRFTVLILLVSSGWLLCLFWLQHNNPRLLASWHGFLHTAIATQFAEGSIPPENPFFAGEKLPYYWFYHFCGYLFSRLAGIDPLHAFQWIAAGSLLTLLIFSGLIGYKHMRSTAAGLLIGYLALAGLNPFGPLIALAKNTIRGTALVDEWSRQTPVETVFVSDSLADDLMSKPLLPALYVSSDWRNGQNVVWFLDNSSRGITLAMISVLFFFLLQSKRSILVAVVSAIATALNPVIGCALSIVLAVSAFTTRPFTYRFLAPIAGSLAAAPFYYHLLLVSSGNISLTPSLTYTSLRIGAFVSNFVILLPLAILGSRDRKLRNMTIAGLVLLAIFPLVVIAPKNTHNLSNLAQCLLAVPAGAFLGSCRKRIQIVFVLLFLPMTACTLWSFHDRPDLPLAFEERTLHRTPENHPLEKLYVWIREHTPADAIFLIDPDRAVKMSGNVSELPALTSRALFVDQESYLTAPYADANARTVLARNASLGKTLTSEQMQCLRDLKRPVFLVIYHDQDLTHLYGTPSFSSGFIALYQLK